MATVNKTRERTASVTTFLAAVKNARRREDAQVLLKMMKAVTRTQPKMWGPSIVGFGRCHYRYESGRESDMPMIGFSPRRAALVLYMMPGFERYEDLMQQLGKHGTGRSCLYINKLDDVDTHVLRALIIEAYRYMKKKHG